MSHELDPDFDLYKPLYAFVRQVPPGKVVTYGQAAACASGVSLTARQAGTAMRYAPPDVPWQRVVGAGGYLPIGKRSPEAEALQRRLLQEEGAVFHSNNPDRIDMSRSQWQTPASDSFQESLF